jgi:Ca2+-binding EF-hand superfamily protein
MTKMKLAIAFCACLIGGVAVAAPRWDANGDGTVDPAEKAKRHEEMKAKRQEMKAQMLAKFDINKDGKLDDAERATMMEARATEAFKRLDTDGNGSLSLAEFKAGKKHFGKRGGGRHMRRGFHKNR